MSCDFIRVSRKLLNSLRFFTNREPPKDFKTYGILRHHQPDLVPPQFVSRTCAVGGKDSVCACVT